MFKRFILFFALVLSALALSPAAVAQNFAMSFKGVYGSGTTYFQGAVVTEGGAAYVSQIPNNIGHDPALDNGTNWQPLSSQLSATGFLQKTNSSHKLVDAAPGVDYGTPITLAVSAIARYDMLHISGSTLLDSSGNGNNATFTSSPPTPIAAGLAMTATSGVTLPAAVNAARTFVISLFVLPTLGQTEAQAGANQWAFTSSIFTTGYNFANVGQNWGVASYAGGSWTNSCYATESGYHTYVITLGTGSGDLNHTYIDGFDCGGYYSQGFSAGAQSSGNLYLGVGPTGTLTPGPIGTDYWFEAFAYEFTAAQALAETASVNALIAQRGVQQQPAGIIPALPQLVAGLDSITSGAGSSTGNTSWLGYLSLLNQPSYNIVNVGIAGDKLLRARKDAPYRDAPQCVSLQGPNLFVLFGGTNDLNGDATVAPSVYGNLISYTQLLKKAGCRVYWGTMLSRTGTGYDAAKNAYNLLMLQGAKANGAEIIDFAATVLGADGGFSNATYNSGDGVHPNDAGYSLLGAAASNKLNYDFGYSDANPHSLAATGAYTMTAADGSLDIASASTSSSLTLPSCVGQTGAVYRINNLQAANTVTVIGSATSQPINGLTTAITVPSHGSLALRDVRNTVAAAGCHWEY